MSPIGGYCCKSRFGVAKESLRAVDAFCAPRRRLRSSQNVLQRSVELAALNGRHRCRDECPLLARDKADVGIELADFL
jgi:hypothetical protein